MVKSISRHRLFTSLAKKYLCDMDGLNKLILIAFLVICVIIGCMESYVYYDNPHYETITVTDKSVDVSGEERWLIYTKNEVYCTTDLIFSDFFESSDVYNSIEVGKTYKVYVSGNRVPIASGYKVIRKAYEVH